MRVSLLFSAVIVFAAVAAAQIKLPTQPPTQAPTTDAVPPSWEKAVQDAAAALTARESDVTKLHTQCQSLRGTLVAKRTAHEESQQNVVSKKVVVTQATSHHRSATASRDTAKATLDAFRAGPFTAAQTAWQQQLAQKPDLETKQSKISLSRQDLARDFPPEARPNAQRDLDALQIEVTRRVTAFNNAKVAYDAAVLTMNQHSANLKAAQVTLNSKEQALKDARAAEAIAIQQATSRLNERKAARVAYDTCVNQLTQAKQAKVAAVGGLRSALETLLQNLKAAFFSAQQNQNNKQSVAQTTKSTVEAVNKQVKFYQERIDFHTRMHAEANRKLARAIADYTVAQTHVENAKQRALRMKHHVEKAKARVDQFNIIHPPATSAPIGTAKPTAVPVTTQAPAAKSAGAASPAK